MPPAPTAILLISCPDRRGIVARVASFIAEQGGNILESDHHLDREVGIFFMRTEFDLTAVRISRAALTRAFARIARTFRMHWRIAFRDERPRVAILVSGLDHCLQDLLWRQAAGEWQADVRCVLSDRPDLGDVVERQGIPFIVIPLTRGRAAQERAMLEVLRREAVECLILARYMRILSPAFVRRYPNQMLNIHHSFLPAFVGARPYHQAYARGVKIIGATSHYVTAHLDEGPIIAQETVRVGHRDSLQDLIRKGRDLERLVLARAVRAHLEYRVMVYRNKTVVFE